MVGKASGRQLGTLVALAAWLLCAWGSPARAVTVSKEDVGGRPVYVLSSSGLRVEVDPARGGEVTLSVPALDGQARPLRARLAQDKAGPILCKYRVLSEFSSPTVGALTLVCSDGSGLRVEKSLSLVEGQQAVRLGWRIENRSPQDARLHSISHVQGGADVRLHVSVRTEAGLIRQTGSLGQPLEADYVRWFSVGDAEGNGVVLVAGSGALSRLLLRTGEGAHELTATGTSAFVPTGQALQTRLTLAPFSSLRSLTNATEQVLCSAELDGDAERARLRLRLVPLGDLGGPAVLRLGATTGRPEAVAQSAPRLAAGEAADVTLRWAPAGDAVWRATLSAPNLKEDVVLGFCQLTGEGAAFVPGLSQPMPREKLTELGTSPSEAEGADDTASSGVLHGPRGEELTRVRLDVGVGEREALIVAFGSAGPPYGGQPIAQVSAGPFAMKRGVRRLPASAVDFLRVVGRAADGKADVPGIVVEVPGPSWKSAGLAGLRFTIPDAEPGAYHGRIEFRAPHQRAVLPIEVRVWPVERPRPGFVKLYVNGPACEPFAGYPDPIDAGGRRAEREIANVALGAKSLLEADLTVRTQDGRSVRLEEWLQDADPRAWTGALPSLDLSGMNRRLDGFLLAGVTDVVVCGELSPSALRPADVSGGVTERAAEWFWSEVAGHLRARGFGELHFMGTAPRSAEALDDDWFAAAGLLARAGWAVSGPYEQDVLASPLLGAAARLSPVLVVSAEPGGALRPLADRLPPGKALGLWMKGLPEGCTALAGRRLALDLAAGGASLIVFDSAGEGGESADGSSVVDGGTGPPFMGLTSLAWEGVRDGLDEANYRRALSWRRRRLGAEDPGMDAPGGATQRDSLVQLTALAGDAARGGVSAYWRDQILVESGQPRAIIAVAPGHEEQDAAARFLNETIRAMCGVSLPVVVVRGPLSPGAARTVIVLGSPETNPVIAEMAVRQADFRWKLRRNGQMIVESSAGGVRYVALVSADPRECGRTVVRFRMLLRQEGGWFGP